MSNDNIDYHSKYLKYKKKYLDLKTEIEGGKSPKPIASSPPGVDKKAAMTADKIKAGKDLYTAGYKKHAGMIKGTAGVCLATKDTLNKFHETQLKHCRLHC